MAAVLSVAPVGSALYGGAVTSIDGSPPPIRAFKGVTMRPCARGNPPLMSVLMPSVRQSLPAPFSVAVQVVPIPTGMDGFPLIPDASHIGAPKLSADMKALL